MLYFMRHLFESTQTKLEEKIVTSLQQSNEFQQLIWNCFDTPLNGMLNDIKTKVPLTALWDYLTKNNHYLSWLDFFQADITLSAAEIDPAVVTNIESCIDRVGSQFFIQNTNKNSRNTLFYLANFYVLLKKQFPNYSIIQFRDMLTLLSALYISIQEKFAPFTVDDTVLLDAWKKGVKNFIDTGRPFSFVYPFFYFSSYHIHIEAPIQSGLHTKDDNNANVLKFTITWDLQNFFQVYSPFQRKEDPLLYLTDDEDFRYTMSRLSKHAEGIKIINRIIASPLYSHHSQKALCLCIAEYILGKIQLTHNNKSMSAELFVEMMDGAFKENQVAIVTEYEHLFHAICKLNVTGMPRIRITTTQFIPFIIADNSLIGRSASSLYLIYFVLPRFGLQTTDIDSLFFNEKNSFCQLQNNLRVIHCMLSQFIVSAFLSHENTVNSESIMLLFNFFSQIDFYKSVIHSL